MSDNTSTNLAFYDGCLYLAVALSFHKLFPITILSFNWATNSTAIFVSCMPRKNETKYVEVRRYLYQSSILHNLPSYSTRRCSFKDATLLFHHYSILLSLLFVSLARINNTGASYFKNCTSIGLGFYYACINLACGALIGESNTCFSSHFHLLTEYLSCFVFLAHRNDSEVVVWWSVRITV